MSSWHMIGTYLVHGWFHFFMVQVDHKLFGTCWYMVYTLSYGTGWCMVDALVYGTSWLQFEVQVDGWLMHGSVLLVQVYNGKYHSDSVTVVPSF